MSNMLSFDIILQKRPQRRSAQAKTFVCVMFVIFTVLQYPAQAGESDYVRRWVANHGGCTGSAITLADHPRGSQDQYYLDISGPEWTENVLIDYARVVAECRAQARAGDLNAEPTTDDRAAGFSLMGELKREWLRYVQDTPVRTVLPSSNGIARGVGARDLRDNVDRFAGQKVRALFITGCFTYGGKYACTPTAESIFGSVIIVGDELTGAEWKHSIDANCRNMGIARSYKCRPEWVSFTVDAYDTDVTGRVRIIKTKSIIAEGNLVR